MIVFMKLLLIFYIWKCQAKADRAITIQRILPSTSDFYVFKGDIIRTVCTVTYETGVKTVKWHFYDSYYRKATDLQIDNDTRVIDQHYMNDTVVKSVLEILKVPTLASFHYRCRADFKDDTTSKELVQYNYISEKSLPKVNITGSVISNETLGPRNLVEAKYKTTMRFECKLDFVKNGHIADEYISVQLRKNNVTVLERIVAYEIAQNEQFVYHVDKLSVDFGGMYTCRSKLEIKRPYTDFVSSNYVNLTFPLRLYSKSHLQGALTVIRTFPGQDVELVCEIEAYPTPHWSFYFNNTDVKNISNTVVVENCLKIYFVNKENAGFYICVAEDLAHNNTKQQDFLLVVTHNDDDDDGDDGDCDNNNSIGLSQKVFLSVCFMFITFVLLGFM